MVLIPSEVPAEMRAMEYPGAYRIEERGRVSHALTDHLVRWAAARHAVISFAGN